MVSEMPVCAIRHVHDKNIAGLFNLTYCYNLIFLHILVFVRLTFPSALLHFRREKHQNSTVKRMKRRDSRVASPDCLC